MHADPSPGRGPAAGLSRAGAPGARHYLSGADVWPDSPEADAADTPTGWLVAFAAAMAAGDAELDYAIARRPMSGADWPEDVRREWGSRRALARMALHGDEGGEPEPEAGP